MNMNLPLFFEPVFGCLFIYWCWSAWFQQSDSLKNYYFEGLIFLVIGLFLLGSAPTDCGTAVGEFERARTKAKGIDVWDREEACLLCGSTATDDEVREACELATDEKTKMACRSLGIY